MVHIDHDVQLCHVLDRQMHHMAGTAVLQPFFSQLARTFCATQVRFVLPPQTEPGLSCFEQCRYQKSSASNDCVPVCPGPDFSHVALHKCISFDSLASKQSGFVSKASVMCQCTLERQ